MAKQSRSPTDAANNYVSNTANAQSFYESRASSADWKSGAGSPQAENNYKTAMQQVIAQGSRNAAIQSTPNEVYQSGVRAGAGRYSSGTAAAKAKVEAVMNKLIPDINSAKASLPARGPRGSTQNIMARGTGIQTALAKNRGKYKARGISKSSGGV